VHRVARIGALLAALGAGLLGGCLGDLEGAGVTEPVIIGEGRRALFIGNSYTYYADIPGLVQAMADSAGGDKIAVETVAGPDMALVDHWKEGTAKREIAEGGWEWVVLQQGPSSVQVNRDSLRTLTQMFGVEISKVSAKAALLSAWPSATRMQDFDRAIESYALAASDVSGILLPVASSWKKAWEADASLQMYSDGLHPSAIGAYLAAATIYSKLLSRTPVGLPLILRTRGGLVISVSPTVGAILQNAAASVNGF
jgi:hypothetical protein